MPFNHYSENNLLIGGIENKENNWATNNDLNEDYAIEDNAVYTYDMKTEKLLVQQQTPKDSDEVEVDESAM